MKITLFLFLIIQSSFAFKLIKIQAVSSSGRTFVTRQGKADGIIPGQLGTFTSENLSFIAKAKTVSRDYTQWESSNENFVVPLESGVFVTYNKSEDHIWTLTPEVTRKKYLKKFRYENKRALHLRTALSRGLAASTSGSGASSEKNRGGFMMESLYEATMNTRFSLSGGFRYERELINVEGGQFQTYRAMLIGELTYYFFPIAKFYSARPYMTVGFGYGYSGTQSTGFDSRGTAAILPALKTGLSFPLMKDFNFTTDLGVESISSLEKSDTTDDVRTSQVNMKLSLGIKKFF